jgi:hypothetical protein
MTSPSLLYDVQQPKADIRRIPTTGEVAEFLTFTTFRE